MRALILSTHTGGGHDTAARAIAAALEEQGVLCRIEDCVAFGGKHLSSVVSGAYVKWVQIAPGSFGRMYRFAHVISTPHMKSPVYLINATYARNMEKLLDEFMPDMIVCTHIFGAHSVTHLRRHDIYGGLLAVVMTDYTIHPFSEDAECDVLFLSNAARQMTNRLRLPQRAYQYTGIPVSLDCKPCLDKRAAKEAAGLDPTRPEVVLVGGSMGTGDLPEMIRRILPVLGEKGHLTVVCASNTKAQQQAQELFGSNPHVTVRGRVVPLTGLIAAADVLVTKSGGLTSTEAMTIGTPLVISRPIAGCETENATYMEQNELALWAHTDKELAEKVAYLLRNPQAREAMIANQHRLIDPNCARNIAKILVDRTNEMMGRKKVDA